MCTQEQLVGSTLTRGVPSFASSPCVEQYGGKSQLSSDCQGKPEYEISFLRKPIMLSLNARHLRWIWRSLKPRSPAWCQFSRWDMLTKELGLHRGKVHLSSHSQGTYNGICRVEVFCFQQ